MHWANNTLLHAKGYHGMGYYYRPMDSHDPTATTQWATTSILPYNGLLLYYYNAKGYHYITIDMRVVLSHVHTMK